MEKEIDDTTIKDVISLFKLKEEINSIEINDITNLFRLKKENQAIKEYYKPVILVIFGVTITLNMKVKVREIKHYQLKSLNIIRPYLKDIINNVKTTDTWEIQFIIAINCVSSKDNDEECVMHSKRDNKEIMVNDKADEIIKKKKLKSFIIDIKIN